MIKLKGKVTHDGKSYEPGQTIEKINNKQAQRLIDLGVAFFIGEKQNSSTPENKNQDDTNHPDNDVNLKEELDAIDYNDLKEVSKEIGLEFKGNISKKDLITLIIENEKAQEILELTEVEE